MFVVLMVDIMTNLQGPVNARQTSRRFSSRFVFSPSGLHSRAYLCNDDMGMTHGKGRRGVPY